MLRAVVLIVAGVLIIFAGCELFVNSIEWLGRKMRLAESAVGKVLAALGTALPESLVTLIALLSGGNSSLNRDIGLGAIIGGPLMLATAAYFFVGLTAIATRRRRRHGTHLLIKQHGVSRDVLWFMLIFAVATGVSLASSHAANLVVAAAILTAYLVYVVKELGEEAGEMRKLNPLHFHPRVEVPETWRVALQVVLGVLAMIYGAHVFVDSLATAAAGTGVPAIVLSMLLSPVATELPEMMNAVLWVRQGKDDLAVGNVSGSMLVQSAIPCSLGLIFTPWQFSLDPLLGIAAIFASAIFVFASLRRGRLTAHRLLFAGIPYLMLVALFLLL